MEGGKEGGREGEKEGGRDSIFIEEEEDGGISIKGLYCNA